MKKAKKKKNKSKKVTSRKKTTNKKRKFKIRYERVFICAFILVFIIYLLVTFVNFPIKNIYISGNTILTDQEVIDLAGISNYPSIISTTSYEIEKRLEKNIYIADAKVRKRKLKEVYIKITENYPLYYYAEENITVFSNLKEVDEKCDCPYVVNYIIDSVYDSFKNKMKEIEPSILGRISEIKYDPNSVDEERFLVTMNDGNYVYLTLEKFESINDYVDIIKNFENKKGILYLDSGEYFKVFE